MMKIKIAAGCAMALLVACGSKKSAATTAGSSSGSSGGGAATKDVTLTGKMSVSASRDVGRDIVLADLTLYCVTFSTPPISGTGTVSGDNSFTLTLANAAGDAFGCFVRSSNATDCGTSPAPCTLATVVFNAAGSKDASGDTLQEGSISLDGGTTDLGSVVIDSTTGVAAVSLPNSHNSSVAGTTGFDPTGTWTLNGVTPLPDGYVAPCAANSQNCNGPQEGQSLFLKRLNGFNFTPDATCAAAVAANQDPATCAGVTGTTPAYGLMVWSSSTAFASCGSALGVSYDQAKAHANVDFTQSGVAGTDTTPTSGTSFTWSTTVNSQSVTDGWYFQNATSQSASISDCYQNTSGHTICGQIDCSLSANQGTPLCTSETNFTVSGSLCANIGTAVPAQGNVIAAANLSAVMPADGDALKLLSDRCYANYFQNNAPRSDSVCLPKLNFNWNATSDQQFLGNNGPPMATTEDLLQLLTYTGPNSATVVDNENGTQEIHLAADANGFVRYIGCQVQQTLTIDFTSVSATSMIGDLRTNAVLSDGNPDCQNNVSQLQLGESRVLVTFTKTSR